MWLKKLTTIFGVVAFFTALASAASNDSADEVLLAKLKKVGCTCQVEKKGPVSVTHISALPIHSSLPTLGDYRFFVAYCGGEIFFPKGCRIGVAPNGTLFHMLGDFHKMVDQAKLRVTTGDQALELSKLYVQLQPEPFPIQILDTYSQVCTDEFEYSANYSRLRAILRKPAAKVVRDGFSVRMFVDKDMKAFQVDIAVSPGGSIRADWSAIAKTCPKVKWD